MTTIALFGAGGKMGYRLSTQPELGTRMRLLWMPLDAASPSPWIVAAVALVGGLLLFRAVVPVVASAWERAAARA